MSHYDFFRGLIGQSKILCKHCVAIHTYLVKVSKNSPFSKESNIIFRKLVLINMVFDHTFYFFISIQ